MTTEAGQEKAGWPVVKLRRFAEQREFSLPVGEVFLGQTLAPESIVEQETYFPEAAITGLVEALVEAVTALHHERHTGAFDYCEYRECEKARDALSAFKQEVE